MINIIDNLLSTNDLLKINELVKNAVEYDGSTSAGSIARRVKNNLELTIPEYELNQLNKLVIGRIICNSLYQQVCLPLRIAAPFYARYKTGMSYGSHTDNPIMGQGALYRSDLSISIFLNEKHEYNGGELVMELENGEQRFKLDAGAAIIYPSTTRHRVSKVTHGQRNVAVTWVQSIIRSDAHRKILSDLARSRELLNTEQCAESRSLIDHSYANLVRLWSDL